MGFVKDHVIPSSAFEDVRVPTGKCVRRYAHIEVMFVIPSLPKFLAPLGSSMVAQDLEPWKKLFELHFPI
jgi:hypothetical protein